MPLRVVIAEDEAIIRMDLRETLEEEGYEAIHVNQILDGDHTKDADLAAYADENGFTVVSKDSDFKNSYLLKSTPQRLLRIALGNLSTQRLLAILSANLDTLVDHFQAGKCMIELGDEYMEVIE